MKVFFGIVKNYIPEKGFGFITHPFSLGINEEIFFHISKVGNSNKDIVEKLSVFDRNCNICFWYELETTRKGGQLKKILKSTDVSKLDRYNLPEFTERVKLMYENIEKPIPFWLNELTEGLIGTNGKEKLVLKRDYLIQERNEKKELQQKEAERLKQIEEEKLEKERIRIAEERQKLIAERERQQMIEDEEFRQLVAEMKSKVFTESSQVSNYIIRNRLGDKYKHISGVLEMENEGTSWKFNGGFPPNIYRMLCIELNLGNKGTHARVVGFTSFNDLK